VRFADGSTHLLEQADGEVGQWPFDSKEVWILTAFNPKSELLSPQENASRHKKLGQQLDELGFKYFAARGFDPAGQAGDQWSEDGYGVLGEVGEEVMRLAEEWGQNAVFIWRPTEWLIRGVLLEGECKSGWRFV
jgi:hypothetical protein